jgi:regulator of cell morphogenesis and NO signaling
MMHTTRVEGALGSATERGFDDLVDLVSHIVEIHHTFARSELARLFTLADTVTTKHVARHPELTRVQELVCALADDLLPHMLKEERLLFPYLVSLETQSAGGPRTIPPFGSVTRPIDAMHAGHDIQIALLGELRKITGGYAVPSDACNAYRALYEGIAALDRDLLEHIHLEDHLAFPRAEELERRLDRAIATPSYGG